MSFEVTDDGVRLAEGCGFDDAEPLLNHLLDHEGTPVDLRAATSMHSAVVQVLLACQPPIAAPPENETLRNWLIPSLEEARAT